MPKYSQFEHEEWLVKHFGDDYTGIAVDIGANNGTFFSNTLLLEEMGWRVLCVEPNHRCWADLEYTRKEVYRCAASDYNGTGVLKVMWSNVDAGHTGINASGTCLNPPDMLYRPIVAKDDVDVRTLDSILEGANVDAIDLLSIDCEGDELCVLDGFDVEKYRPRVIIVEHHYNQNEIYKRLPKYSEVLKFCDDLVFTRNAEPCPE